MSPQSLALSSPSYFYPRKPGRPLAPLFVSARPPARGSKASNSYPRSVGQFDGATLSGERRRGVGGIGHCACGAPNSNSCFQRLEGAWTGSRWG